jgi:colicin V production protein
MSLTWIDVLTVVLIAGYMIAGWWSGLIRRVIGFIGLYLGVLVATYAGHAGVSVLRQADPSLAPSDAKIYMFFGSLALIIVLVEVVASLYHQEVQVSLVAVNHGTGALIGGLTGFAAAVLCWVLLGVAGSPLGGSLTTAQVHIREQVHGSFLGPRMLQPAVGAVEATFSPVLPRQLDTYFNGSPG